MDREKLLAAETFSYSYANYADHLGNIRHEGVLHSSTSRSKHAPCAYVRHEGVPHSSKFWK